MDEQNLLYVTYTQYKNRNAISLITVLPIVIKTELEK